MNSAFGIDHGEFSKGVGSSLGAGKALKRGAKTVKEFGSGFKTGAKLARANRKQALSDSGYATTIRGNMKDAYRAGRAGGASPYLYRSGQKGALKAGKERTLAQVKGKPEPVFGYAMGTSLARSNRKLALGE